MKNIINTLLSFKELKQKERKVLDVRFGLSDGITHTLKEVGE